MIHSSLQMLTLAFAIGNVFTTSCLLMYLSFGMNEMRERVRVMFRCGSLATLAATIHYAILVILVSGDENWVSVSYITPVFTSVEILSGIYGTMSVVHASRERMMIFNIFTFLGLLAVLLYPVMYSEWTWDSTLLFTWNNYIMFTQTIMARAVSLTIHILLVTTIITGMWGLVRGYFRYQKISYMYFGKDLSGIRNKAILWICLLIFILVVYIFNLVFYSQEIMAISLIFLSVLYGTMGAILIKYKDVMNRIETAFSYIKRKKIVCDDNPEMEIDTVGQTARMVDKRLEAWTNRADKPWNTVGLLVTDVARDVNIPADILVRYIHLLYGMSFRSWVLSFRNKLP